MKQLLLLLFITQCFSQVYIEAVMECVETGCSNQRTICGTDSDYYHIIILLNVYQKHLNSFTQNARQMVIWPGLT
ncbi:hypothetical protein pb186bvf_002754 [Paramecium bursaria]